VFRVCGCNGAGNTAVLLLSLNPACTASRLTLFSTLPMPPRVEGGWAGDGEGTQLGQLTQTSQGDVPHHVTSCSAIKTSSGRRRIVGELSPKVTSAQRLAGNQCARGQWQVIPFVMLGGVFFFSLSHLLTWVLS